MKMVGEMQLIQELKKHINTNNMTIEKWLSDVYYDKWGQMIFNKIEADGASELIADIRGWGSLQYKFETDDEAAKFQNEVGMFITEAIREKIERLKNK